MPRVEALVPWAIITALVLLVLYLAVAAFGIQAVFCTQPSVGVRDPAMNVRVTTDRKGHIIERHLFGCTFYDYRGPPWATGHPS
jgi:hypothetical protein